MGSWSGYSPYGGGHVMDGLFAALALLVIFALFSVTIRPLFKMSSSSVALLSIVLVFLLVLPFHPVYFVLETVGLAVGLSMGYRGMPSRAIGALGLSPWYAGHASFHKIAEEMRSAVPPQRTDPFDSMNTQMHLGTLAFYRNAVFWGLASAAGCMFCYGIGMSAGLGEAILFCLIQPMLTAFPMGLLLKRWRALRTIRLS